MRTIHSCITFRKNSNTNRERYENGNRNRPPQRSYNLSKHDKKMRTMPITSDRNDPRYQEKTVWSREVIGEPCTDDRSEDCVMLGTYRSSGSTIDFDVDDFRMIPVNDGYEPLFSKESMHEIIRDLIKAKHGRNVNFV